MRQFKRMAAAGGRALRDSCAAEAAQAASDKVVIGDIDDMSGPYADVIGAGGVEAIKMAIADFGGTVLGKPIEILTADHQNKPDIGQQKFREWADTGGLTMLLGGSNTGVSLAMSAAAKEKKIPFFAIGAAGASLTGKDCNALHDPLRLRHERARQRHGQDHPRRGRQELVLHHRRLRLRQAARGGRLRRREGGRRKRGRRRARAARHVRFLLLPPAGAGVGRAGARPRQRRRGLRPIRSRLRPNSASPRRMKPAALLVFLTDIHAVGPRHRPGPRS